MENKLGIKDNFILKELEYYLFNIKYHLVDEYINFNLNNFFSIDYLEKMHLFLFEEIYDEKYCKVKENISIEVKEKINSLLKEAQELMNNYDSKKFGEIIYEIWENQIFYDGNTRTLLCFIKVVSNVYKLNIEYDFEKNINKDYFINEIIDAINNEKVR